MKRLVTMALLVVALVICAAQLLTPVVQAAGGSSCPKNTPVKCYNCDGTFAYCARSHAFCPECAAP